MKQNLRLFMLTLLCAVFSSAWAQEVTYDFTGSDWSVSDGALTNGTVSFTGEGPDNFKMNTGYFMMGKKDAYIKFPTFDFAVGKIEVVGRNGASSSTKMNVFVGDVAVSTETTGCTGTNTYAIATNYQAAETQYTLKVTSAHNAQITAIKIYKAGSEETLTLKTIAEAREQATGEVLTKGVITSLNGNYAYIQDTFAAIYVYGGCGSFAIGDEIEVKGTLTTYYGLMEITNPTCTLKSQNNTVTPEVMTIDQVNASTNQGWLIKIEEATVTAISGSNVTIAQGENTVTVRFNKTSDITFAVNDIITLTGNIGCFNTVQIANPRDVTKAENNEPFIKVAKTELTAPATETYAGFRITIQGIQEDPMAVQFYSAAGEEVTPPDWLDVTPGYGLVDYYVAENTETEPRTAYFKLWSYGSAAENENTKYYSDLITLTQEAYVAPPTSKTYQKVTSTEDITDGNYLIVYEGGVSNGQTVAPVAFNGNLAKFDAVKNTIAVTIDDGVIIDDNDAYFTIDTTNKTIKGASGKYIGVSSYSNSVLSSEDPIEHKTISIENGSAVITVSTTDGDMTLRFNYASDQLRFRYFKNGQQPIALYKEVDEIVKEPTVLVNTTEVNVDAEGGDGTITVTYKNFEETEIEADIAFYAADGETSSTYDWVTASIGSENNVSYTVAANSGEARTAYLKVYAMDGNGDNVYSDLITINQGAYVVDFASIPFEFNGGQADIETTDGLTHQGVDIKDYSTETTKLKFNTEGDWMILKLNPNEEHGNLSLSFDIKANGSNGSFSGVFTVMTSVDGETYETLGEIDELTDAQTETEIFDVASNVKYIKWIFTTKSTGNFGIGNIILIETENIDVTFNKRAEGYSTLYYGTKNLIIPNGVKASTYKVGDDGKYVETEYESIIPKGSAVVIELEDKSLIANGNKDVTFTTTAATETAHTDNMLYGFDEDDQWTVGPDETKEYLFYSLSLNAARDEGSIGFYWNNKDGNDNGGQFKIPAHRAYLAVEKETANGVSAFAFDGIGTGINGIFANGLPTDGVFTLTGVRVNSDSLQKGIYIVNGKKVVIK